MPYQFTSQAKLPTRHGEFDIHVFIDSEAPDDKQEHVMLTVGLPRNDENSTKTPLIRIHSECLTGDAFSSLKCDCGPQLNSAMQMIQAHGCGAILYLRQEGRGIGLVNKIRAYALQDQGHDTLDANLMLGLPADARTYEMCKPMLDHVAVNTVNVLTNNPNKVKYLTDLGIKVTERIPLVVGVNEYNSDYLSVKRDRMGHMLNEDLDGNSVNTSHTEN
ncbi:GTP cyclohydrolase II [Psychrobacter sp. HD31]|uniref:GTP cyclohydrolase II n=1 Tax=Psychrobacter sp. HD31 TaxID=3112003 RepID=UPI003DA65E75